MSKGNEAESSQQGDKEADPAPHLEAGQSLIAEEKAQSELAALFGTPSKKPQQIMRQKPQKTLRLKSSKRHSAHR